MTLDDLLDPLLDASWKGIPHHAGALRRSAIGAQGWNVLRGDLPLPLAVIRRDALAGNLSWMQEFAANHGVGLAPHGKTTMSPQLFRRQLDAGAWGMTFATVGQLRAGVAAGARRCIIANQVFQAVDLRGISEMKRAHPDLAVAFLVDSMAQLDLVETWHAANADAPPFDVLLEIGVAGARTGCRTHEEALAVAQRLHASAATRLVGIECYEGLGATGKSEADIAYANALMERVRDVARACDAQQLFEGGEILLTAGGSAIFDLVADALKLALSRPVRGLLRSGCYVTHDHGTYHRFLGAVSARMGCGHGLHAAMEVWAAVQSCPEPGLAILSVGKRDISYDLELPQPIAFRPRDGRDTTQAPADWKITGLNDQHAYLRGTGAEHAALRVGDLVALGISHPCTTFDKWRWIPVVDAQYNVRDAIVTCF
ncbi:amino acid deaminase [Ramlibacter pallidus]|uniref:Amino acid deaminase n=1 Tax=Ramlibacter pallidus TaxID=2780087 RepID=A0ABR9S0R2_9BURK|nr:amino acid deaminase [Ramlibacter pallidus]MBE7367034.1 amino acid deaminase [Ramlibacter pallidus]